jgi:DNA-binding ferritin-like protein
MADAEKAQQELAIRFLLAEDVVEHQGRAKQAAGKYDHINFKPPESVANAAAKGLEYRQKASPSNRGGLTPSEASKEGIGSGVSRATSLKNRSNVSPKVIGQMVGFFSRHEKNKGVKPEHKNEPWNDKGHVAWLLWGGDAGKTWATKVKSQMDAADAKAKQAALNMTKKQMEQLHEDGKVEVDGEFITYKEAAADVIAALEDACWEGYEAIGMKEQDGRTVPNCVPKQAKTAKSNAKMVEVPNTFHPVKLEPPKKKRTEFPYEGFIDFQGLKIDVENAMGSTRRGKGPDGEWTTYMHCHYGEIRGTEGTDGDKLDVYVGENHDSPIVVVVHQHNPWDGKFDEDKVMVGFDSVEEAIGTYKKQYDRPGFYKDGEHTAMPMGKFWRWVHEERNKGKRVKAASQNSPWKDQVPGGRADKKNPSDFDPKQLQMGVEIEQEHTKDRALAEEIAMDHLTEFPDYYTRLKKMEDEAEGKKVASLMLRLTDQDMAGLDSMLGFNYADPATKREERQVAAILGRVGPDGQLKASRQEALLLASWKAIGQHKYDPSSEDLEADPRFVQQYLKEWGRPGKVASMPPNTAHGFPALLALLRAVGWSHWTAHWQTEGPEFYADHQLFDRLYGTTIGEIDQLAEKLVAKYGAEAVHPVGQANLMTTALVDWSSEGDPIQRALWAERALQIGIKACREQAQEDGELSLGMDDFLAGLANKHEEHLYLLGQRAKGRTASQRWASSSVQRVAARHFLKKLAAQVILAWDPMPLNAAGLKLVTKLRGLSSNFGIAGGGEWRVLRDGNLYSMWSSDEDVRVIQRKAGDWERGVQSTVASFSELVHAVKVKVSPRRGKSTLVETTIKLSDSTFAGRAAAQVGTDTASVYAIDPCQIERVVDKFMARWADGDFAGADQVWREHGGAVFHMGADGAYDVQVPGSLKEWGYTAPYGTPDYGKQASRLPVHEIDIDRDIDWMMAGGNPRRLSPLVQKLRWRSSFPMNHLEFGEPQPTLARAEQAGQKVVKDYSRSHFPGGMGQVIGILHWKTPESDPDIAEEFQAVAALYYSGS